MALFLEHPAGLSLPGPQAGEIAFANCTLPYRKEFCAECGRLLHKGIEGQNETSCLVASDARIQMLSSIVLTVCRTLLT